MNKEKLYWKYIKGAISESEAKDLQDMLRDDAAGREELFEMKHIADTAASGAMPLREQERKVLDLRRKAEELYRKTSIRKTIIHVAGYAAISAVAFITGALLFSPKDNISEQMICISTGAGDKTDMQLPDGTLVTLKSSSSLEYDIAAFAKGERKVTLDGEAFFDVAKDQERKFIISTQRQDVTVHGTSFCLQAYDDDSSNTLSLLQGSVTIDLYSTEGSKIRSLNLNSMERCRWDLRSGKTSVEKIDSTEIGLGWKDNIYYFKEADIISLTERLEKYYGISISTEGLEKNRERFSGAISLNQDIKEIMRMLNYDRKYCISKSEEGNYTISPATE